MIRPVQGAKIADQYVCISCWGTYIDESDPWNNPSWKLGDENSSTEASEAVTTYKTHEQRLVDYISFRIPEDSFSNIRNYIGIARGFMHDLSSVKKGNAPLEAVLLSVPDGYHCVDLCLFTSLIFITGCLYDLLLSKTGKSNRIFLLSLIEQPDIHGFIVLAKSVKLCNKEGLKASSIALTALAEYTGFGFGTTPTFGQSTSASAGSSFFGTALSAFGDQNSFLGGQHGRSRVAAYTATAEVDDGSSAAKLESISAMTINKDKSHEELRATCSLMCCFLFSGHGLIAVAAYYWRLPSSSRLPSG
ncbi:hypothetical protein ACSBR1_041150 [Camellia fascicularis]